MDKKTSEQDYVLPPEKRNPTGKGGFRDNPQNRNSGGRPKNAESFAYWYRAFKNMTLAELKDWPNNNPEDSRTVAADLAYRRIFNSQKDLKEFQEVADRSEGKAKQSIDMSVGGELNVALVEFVGQDNESDKSPDTDTV